MDILNTSGGDATRPNEGASLAALILRRAGIYSDETVERIVAMRTANAGMGLAEAAVKFGGAKERDFLAAVGQALGLETVDLETRSPSPEALAKLPASAVNQFGVLPWRVDGDALTVVSSDPFGTAAADGLRMVAGCRVRTALAPKEDVEKAIKKFYGVGAEAIEKMLEDGRYEVGDDIGAMTKIDVSEMGEEASIVRFVNQIIAEADRQGATDIHIEPQETELRIRYRIDGSPRSSRASRSWRTSTSPKSGCRWTAASASGSAARTSTSASRRCRRPTASRSPCDCSRRAAAS